MSVLAQVSSAMLAVRAFFAGRVLRLFARDHEQPTETVQLTAPEPILSLGGESRGEELGRWRFRGQILDNLDHYFDTLRRLASAEPDLYYMTSRIGSVLVPRNSAALGYRVDMPAGQEPPSFGSFFWPPDDDAAGENPRFLAFQRIGKRSPYVEKTNQAVYEITVVHQNKDRGSLLPPQQFHMALNADGTAHLLRERRPVVQSVRGKNGRRFAIHHGRGKLAVPRLLELMAEDRTDGKTPEQIAQLLFCWTANLLIQAQMSLRVSIERRGLIAAFHIDTERTPYFFNDRDAIPGKRRKKIFHIVRTHERTTATGKTTFVRSHFRGERKFTWNGYGVTISMPGFHHADLLEMKADALHAEEGEVVPNTYTPKQAGNLIRQHLLH